MTTYSSVPPLPGWGRGQTEHHRTKGNPSSCVCRGTMLEAPFQGLRLFLWTRVLGLHAFLGGGPTRNVGCKHCLCDVQKRQFSGDAVAQVHSTRWRWKKAFGGLVPPCSQVPETTDLIGFLCPSSVLPALPLAPCLLPTPSLDDCPQPAFLAPVHIASCILSPTHEPSSTLPPSQALFLSRTSHQSHQVPCVPSRTFLVTGSDQSPLLHVPSQARKVQTKDPPPPERDQTHPSLAFLRQ